ncbi:MAG: polyhydroxyalkanoate depolymerase, partial [Rhizobiales bacterium]|nr:polyhydroxyalkanoate depolymerase [Rhizobacter sp.]
MMYQAYQAQSDLMWPLRTIAKLSVPMLQDSTFGFAAQSAGRRMAAACKVLALAEVTHKRPPWRIESVMTKGEAVPVV